MKKRMIISIISLLGFILVMGWSVSSSASTKTEYFHVGYYEGPGDLAIYKETPNAKYFWIQLFPGSLGKPATQRISKKEFKSLAKNSSKNYKVNPAFRSSDGKFHRAVYVHCFSHRISKAHFYRLARKEHATI